jgi:serine/threonine protein kinase
MDNEDYPLVSSDKYAMKLYVDKICSQVPANEVSAYISSHYGRAVKVMGEGSFGKVTKYKKDDQLYAIKVPSNFDYMDVFKEINSSECIKSLLHDDEELKRMAYIYECVRPRSKNPHLIMKFLPFTLGKYIKAKYPNGWAGLDHDGKIKMLTQMYSIAKTLNALHSKNIAHRDLKPENMMVTSKGTPFLVDFGTATPMGNDARTLVGTPYFVDYEVMNRNSKGLFSDVYSLLMTYVEMIHGKRGSSVLDAILNSGGYMQVRNGHKSKYEPKYSACKIPSELSWMENMFIPSRSGRWTIPQVIQQFEKVLGISSKKEVPQISQPIPVEKINLSANLQKVEIPVQKKADDVSEALEMINKAKQNIGKIERNQPRQEEIMAISKEPKQEEIIAISKNPKYKNPYLHPQTKVIDKIEKDFVPTQPEKNENKYADRIRNYTPITQPKKIFENPDEYKNNYIYMLDKNRQADFQRKQKEINDQIDALLKQREQRLQARPIPNQRPKQAIGKKKGVANKPAGNKFKFLL